MVHATAENFFVSISRPQIIEALKEAGQGIAPAWEKAKKRERPVSVRDSI
jgi:hypothetical protein